MTDHLETHRLNEEIIKRLDEEIAEHLKWYGEVVHSRNENHDYPDASYEPLMILKVLKKIRWGICGNGGDGHATS